MKQGVHKIFIKYSWKVKPSDLGQGGFFKIIGSFLIRSTSWKIIETG